MTVKGDACPCTLPAVVTVEWECNRGHKGYAALCRNHGSIHVAALMSEGIVCGACRKQGREVLTQLRRVNGKSTGAFRTPAG